jgi:hypothetical protein
VVVQREFSARLSGRILIRGWGSGRGYGWEEKRTGQQNSQGTCGQESQEPSSENHRALLGTPLRIALQLPIHGLRFANKMDNTSIDTFQ